VALLLKLSEQRPEIVNLTVQNEPNGLIFIGDRLMPACEVNDAETPHSQAYTAAEIVAVIVGSTVLKHMPHAGEQFLWWGIRCS
jgi:hypothetical protein